MVFMVFFRAESNVVRLLRPETGKHPFPAFLGVLRRFATFWKQRFLLTAWQFGKWHAAATATHSAPNVTAPFLIPDVFTTPFFPCGSKADSSGSSRVHKSDT